MELRRLKRELVAALVLVYVLVWLRRRLSLAALALKGLVIYDPPTTEALKEHSVSTPVKLKERKEKLARRRQSSRPNPEPSSDDKSEQDFSVLRTAAISSCPRMVVDSDVDNKIYDAHFEMLVQLLVGSLLLYVGQETVLQVFGPTAWVTDGQGLVFWWAGSLGCIGVVFLCMILVDYSTNGATSETMLALIVGMSSFISTMAILLLSEDIFDFGLDLGYEESAARLRQFGEAHDFPEIQPLSFQTMKMMLALSCGGLGAVLLFPTLRFVRSQHGALRYATGNTLQLICLHSNVVLPLLVVCSFLKLLTKDFEPGMLTGARGFLMLLCAVARLSASRLLVQNYLNTAEERLSKLMRLPKPGEAGHKKGSWASDIKVSAIHVQQLVTRVNAFLPGAAVQVIVPPAVMLSIAILIRAKGDAANMAPEDELEMRKGLLGPDSYRSILCFLGWWISAYTVVAYAIGELWFKFQRSQKASV